MKKSPFLFLSEFVHIVISAAILAMCDAVDADDGKENSIKENKGEYIMFAYNLDYDEGVILENEDVIWASRSNLNIDTYVRNTICMPT